MVDNNIPITSIVGAGPAKKKQKAKCGVTTVTKISTILPNVEKLQRSSSTKRPTMGLRLFRGKRPYHFFLRRLMPSKSI
jgi:hypothetical protein